ncbi:MAG: VOC family protein [Alphaproteobacteria bacterium]|nr:VOC family protein [Alphaproteobacteria bacterium]
MHYLHTMIRIRDMAESLHFFCDLLGMKEVRRTENGAGRFTLIFLSADADFDRASGESKSPLLELTYNWPDENGKGEIYTGGRNFGHLAYRVTNIYETCARLKDAGVIINRPPRDGHMAFVKTPDGISLELLQDGAHLPPAEPWVSMPNTGTW